MSQVLRGISMQTKLLSGVFGMALLPVVLTALMLHAQIMPSLESNAAIMISDVLTQIGQSITKEFEALDHLTIRFYSHPDVLRIISNDDLITVTEHDQNQIAMNELIREIMQAKPELMFQLFDFTRPIESFPDQVGRFSYNEESSLLLDWEHFQHDALLQDALDKKGRKSVIGHLQTTSSIPSHDEYVTVLRALKAGKVRRGYLPGHVNVEFGKTLTGVVMIGIKETMLSNLYTSSPLAQTGHIYLVSSAGEVLSSSDQTARTRPFASPVAINILREMAAQQQPSHWIEHQQQPYLLSLIAIPRFDLLLYTLQPQARVMQHVHLLRNMLLLVAGISVATAGLAYWLLANAIKRSRHFR